MHTTESLKRALDSGWWLSDTHPGALVADQSVGGEYIDTVTCDYCGEVIATEEDLAFLSLFYNDNRCKTCQNKLMKAQMDIRFFLETFQESTASQCFAWVCGCGSLGEYETFLSAMSGPLLATRQEPTVRQLVNYSQFLGHKVEARITSTNLNSLDGRGVVWFKRENKICWSPFCDGVVYHGRLVKKLMHKSPEPLNGFLLPVSNKDISVLAAWAFE